MFMTMAMPRIFTTFDFLRLSDRRFSMPDLHVTIL